MHAFAVVRRPLFALVASLAVATASGPLAAQNEPPANPAAGAAGVPPLPDGEPQELLQFVDKVLAQPVPPAPRDVTMKLFRERAALAYEASDKVLGRVKTDDATYEPAVRMKLRSLMMLAQLGDESAPGKLGEFAATLVESPSKTLAREARRMTIIADMQGVFAKRDVSSAGAILERIEALAKDDPSDGDTANLAMQTATALEQFPGGDAMSKELYRRLGPVFEGSDNERTKAVGTMFAGVLRRQELPGNAMEISGTNMDGSAFDQKQLDGKVVLVDFWATWCGPCVAEVPNMLEAYDKYHDRGFEVVGVSLDEDRDAVVQFVKDKMIPWPILHERAEGAGWQHPLATFYGITGIPQMILIGRDGNVITLNARGRALEEKLEELFKDAG